MKTPKEIAAECLACGYSPIPIPPRSKAPKLPGWQRLKLGESDLDIFTADSNIGVLLGEPSGDLVDIDLDHPLAVELAPDFLPPTGMIFGRPGKPRSHWVYTCSAKTAKFKDARGAMIVELRSTGCQTVWPGSTHPSGEIVSFEAEDTPATVDADTLAAACKALCNAVRAKLGQPPIDAPRPTNWTTQQQGEHRAATITSPYGAAALLNECGAVASTAEGGRNDALHLAAVRIGRLVAGGEIVESDAVGALLVAARQCGLPDHEAASAIRSGIGYGVTLPRCAPPREPEVDTTNHAGIFDPWQDGQDVLAGMGGADLDPGEGGEIGDDTATPAEQVAPEPTPEPPPEPTKPPVPSPLESALRAVLPIVNGHHNGHQNGTTKHAGRIEVVPLRLGLLEHRDLEPVVIDGLIRRGETCNLIAASKTGKSWGVAALAYAAASGGRWLNTFKAAKSGRVLCIDNELRPATLMHRMRVVGAAAGHLQRFGHDLPPPPPEGWEALDADPDEGGPLGGYAINPIDRIDFVALRGKLKDVNQLESDLFRYVDAGRYSLIILDTLYRAMPLGSDENSNTDVTGLYNLLDGVASRLGTGIVVVHHASKGLQSDKAVTDVGAGAGAQSRAVDAHLVFRPHAVKGASVVDGAVRSFPPFSPFAVRWEFPLWTRDDSLDPEELLRPGKRQAGSDDAEPGSKGSGVATGHAGAKQADWGAADVVRCLREAGGIAPRSAATIAELVREAGGPGPRRVTALLDVAAERGLLVRCNGSARAPAAYTLPS